MVRRILAVAAALALLGACTSGRSGSASSAAPPGATGSATPSPGGSASTHVATPPPMPPVHEVRARACPFAGMSFVRATMGMRLTRITVLRSAGRTVGCRFYALQNSPLHLSEHLPGPHQPAVEVIARHLASPLLAHNAFVLLSRQATNAQQVDLGRRAGVCFQTDFYRKDHGMDWACAASVGRTEVVVRTIDTTGTFNTAAVTRAVLRRV